MAQCLVQQWVHAMRQLLVFFGRFFFVQVNSFPEIDSRPAFVGPHSLDKCAQFPLRVAGLLHFEVWTLFPRASRIWQPLLIFLHQKSFSCVRHRRGGGVARSLDSQVTLHQLVSETVALTSQLWTNTLLNTCPKKKNNNNNTCDNATRMAVFFNFRAPLRS